ncbi:MAG: hypothetical protein M0P22_08825, partial [Methanoculleus sp.]|nr:hypothetical protein [Methanoculleus sp.]
SQSEIGGERTTDIYSVANIYRSFGRKVELRNSYSGYIGRFPEKSDLQCPGGRAGGILDGLYSESLLPEINVSDIADNLHISGYLPAFPYLMGT